MSSQVVSVITIPMVCYHYFLPVPCYLLTLMASRSLSQYQIMLLGDTSVPVKACHIFAWCLFPRKLSHWAVHVGKLHIYATALIYTRGKSNCCLISVRWRPIIEQTRVHRSHTFDCFHTRMHCSVHTLLAYMRSIAEGWAVAVHCTLLTFDTENCPACTM